MECLCRLTCSPGVPEPSATWDGEYYNYWCSKILPDGLVLALGTIFDEIFFKNTTSDHSAPYHRKEGKDLLPAV